MFFIFSFSYLLILSSSCPTSSLSYPFILSSLHPLSPHCWPLFHQLSVWGGPTKVSATQGCAHIWGVDDDKNVFRWNSGSISWEQIYGAALIQVDVSLSASGDEQVYGVDAVGRGWKYAFFFFLLLFSPFFHIVFVGYLSFNSVSSRFFLYQPFTPLFLYHVFISSSHLVFN